MPRQAHGRPLQPGRSNGPNKKKNTSSRGLNALEIAERENPDEIKIPQHRLGQVDDDDEAYHDRADANGHSSKRRKIDVTKEEEADAEGSDLEGNRWHEGVDEEDDDSDIDSDDAFGASDEERFADFTFRDSATEPAASKQQVKAAVVTLDEDDPSLNSDDDENNEEDDDFGDEGVDLAMAWDMDDKDEAEYSRKKQKHPVDADSDHDEDAMSPESDIEDDEDASNQASKVEEDAMSAISISDEEGDHARLQDFVDDLAAGDKVPSSKKPRQSRNLPDKPSSFGLASTKVSAADLLQYIKDPQQRKSLKILQSAEERGEEPYKSGIPGKLAPPLAKRQQDRLDRSAAYDESKKELGNWTETVKQNRRAEHLSFPLVDAAAAGMLSGKQLGPTSATVPMTALESTIQNIMAESGMSSKEHRSVEEQEQAYEQLHEQQMALVEVQARRAELRQARDLMFREEIRARRIKKIKSKAYRRVHRKEREKADQQNTNLLAAQGLLNSDDEREKNDRRRAEERMGARHRESKWAKSVKFTGRAAWDDDARHGVSDLARRDEELRRRIEGKADNGSDASESDDSDFDGFSGSEDGRQHLGTKLDLLDVDDVDTTETRLGSMAFMKRAEASRKAINEAEIATIRQSLRKGSGEFSDEFEMEDDVAPGGRQKFGSRGQAAIPAPQQQIVRSEFEELESEHESEEEAREKTGAPMNDKAAPIRLNGNLQHAASALPREPPIAQASLPQVKSVGGNGSRSPLAAASRARNKSHVKKSKVTETEMGDYTSPSESEDEQAALAQAIFAGSNETEREFTQEKKKTVEEEGDRIIDNGLPGWGSWAGEGVSKKAQKRARGRYITTIKGVAQEKRQDVKLEKVIINEKRVKKNGKYLANELPHPFESKQQYERSLRLPLGPEWTTKTTFQDATKPRVLIKQGVIRPMAKPVA